MNAPGSSGEALAAERTTGVAPFFMYGFDRSGTTLLSMMVGAHPRLAVPFSVTGMWYRYEKKLGDYRHLESKEDVVRLVEDLLAEERIGLWDVELDRDALLDGLETGSYGAVVARFHEAYAAAKGKPCWGNIDIATLDEMDAVNRWFPEARFLHIVRDGRDVALSHETYPYGASNTLECAMSWTRRLDSNLKMGSMLASDRYLVVRYEDLVLESEETLGRICSFLGVEYDGAMMEYDQMVKKKVPSEKRWLWPALDKKPVKNNAYRWKRDMSVSKRVVFESNAGELLGRLGYEIFDRVPKRPSAYVLEMWQFLGRGGRFKRLSGKLGRSTRG